MRKKETGINSAMNNPRDDAYESGSHKKDNDGDLFDHRLNNMHRHIPNEDPSKKELQRRIRSVYQ